MRTASRPMTGVSAWYPTSGSTSSLPASAYRITSDALRMSRCIAPGRGSRPTRVPVGSARPSVRYSSRARVTVLPRRSPPSSIRTSDHTPDHPHRRHPIASNDRFRCARPCRVGPETRAAEIRWPRTGPGGGQHRQPAMREQSPQAGRLPTAARTVCHALTRGQRGRVPRSRYIVRWRVDPVTAAKARHSDQAARWISSPSKTRAPHGAVHAPSRIRTWKVRVFRLRSRPSGHPSAPHTRMTQTRNTWGPIAGECRCSAATVTSSVTG